MRNIKKSTNDIYEFVGGDLNPTAKKLVRKGKYTDEIYNKNQILDVLETAVKKGQCEHVLKQKFDSDKDQFTFKLVKDVEQDDSIQQLVTVVVPSESPTTFEINDAKNVIQTNALARLEKMKDATVKLNLKKNIVAIAAIIGSGIVLATMASKVVDMYFDELEMNEQKNREYVAELNEERLKNGVEPIGGVTFNVNGVTYGSNYYENELEEEISHGRKL